MQWVTSMGKTNLKKTSNAQIIANKIIGKYKKINKSELKKFAELTKESSTSLEK